MLSISHTWASYHVSQVPVAIILENCLHLFARLVVLNEGMGVEMGLVGVQSLGFRAIGVEELGVPQCLMNEVPLYLISDAHARVKEVSIIQSRTCSLAKPQPNERSSDNLKGSPTLLEPHCAKTNHNSTAHSNAILLLKSTKASSPH